MFDTIRQIHFVGIGGAGMSGIAEVLLNLGYTVTGSDLKSTEVTERLQSLGAKILYGHKEKNVGNAQVVVTSTAVKLDNPEVIYAKQAKIPVIPRIEMLAELARLKYTVAIAGTHGKTTTTSMVASILQEGGLDPTFIVGGKLRHIQSGAQLGQGKFLVAEADESDGSFLKLSPAIGVITNIDNDHLDYYGSMKKLREAFITFANRVPFYGCTILCGEDLGVQTILPYLNRRVLTYGWSSCWDYWAENLSSNENGAQFQLYYKGKSLGNIQLKVSGRHNVLNAIAASICALELQVPFEKIQNSLSAYESVARRLEMKGQKQGSIWIDDYGHHPTEIKATLSALRERFPKKKLIVLFQPHRYSRTQILLKEFSRSFENSDELILLPIYPAGESPIAGVSSKNLYSLLKKKGKNVSLMNGRHPLDLKEKLKSDTVFLTLGAGDVWKVGQSLFAPVD